MYVQIISNNIFTQGLHIFSLQKRQKFVVNHDKAFTNGNLLDIAFETYEPAVMDFKEKILVTFEPGSYCEYR